QDLWDTPILMFKEHPSHIENVNEVVEYHHSIANSLDAVSTTPNFTKEVKVETNEEPIDTTEASPHDNQADRTDDVSAAKIDNSSNDQQSNNDRMDESDRNVIVAEMADEISDDLIEKKRRRRRVSGPCN
ncbi:hypothetical protein PENTCL1PPCAC_8269, partial [Pristionchus entomophagus]